MTKKRVFLLAAALLVLFSAVGILPITARGETGDTIRIISLKGDITPATAAYLQREIDNAHLAAADGIIIDIVTLGGRVDSALEMRDTIVASQLPVVVFVGTRAISAGALITIAADTIIMAPGSHMGAAEPVPFSEKALAFVSGEFHTTAEYHGRDPLVAVAMVDKDIAIPGLINEGRILDMSAVQALEQGYADAILATLPEVLDFMGWTGARVVEVEPDYKMMIAQFLTRYDVSSILLTIGMLAILMEIFTQGFGAAGIVGISAYALYFSGGVLAGNTEWWSVFLFTAGIVLLLIEASVPGFGVFGFGGIAAMIVSIIFAAPDPAQGAFSLGIALILTAIATPLLFKFLGRAKFFERLVLAEAETVERGYVHVTGNKHLLGRIGRTVTPLRPAGTILLDGRRLDAVSDGGYLPIDTSVKIILVEGARIVVSEHKDNRPG